MLRRRYNYLNDLIINMDEIPLHFDMSGAWTIHKKGCKEVRVRSCGAEKRPFTVILSCTAAGAMLSPILILKGRES